MSLHTAVFKEEMDGVHERPASPSPVRPRRAVQEHREAPRKLGYLRLVARFPYHPRVTQPFKERPNGKALFRYTILRRFDTLSLPG